MPISDIILKMPWWYLLILFVFSMYYAIRGIMEQMAIHAQGPLNRLQRVIIAYIQEFLFKTIMTASGFLALFIANYIFACLKSLNDIGAGTAVILIFLIFWGITGVSGYLTFLIVSGRFPTLK
jgi:uncharacterized membrane protein YhaH (DUF805 family)